MEIIVGIVFVVGGLLFLFLAGLLISRSVRRLRDWESSPGRVIGFDESDRAGRRFFWQRTN